MTKRTVVILFSLLIAYFAFGSSAGPVTLRPPDQTIPIGYFGMHFHHVGETIPWPKISFGSWRLLGTYVDWPHLEPKHGQWDFQTSDKFVALAEQQHVVALFPLVLTPPWASAHPAEKSYYSPGNAGPPKDIADWQEYVQMVATRYKGRIHEYEIWNEPNLKGFYGGSIPEMVQMARVAYQTLKRVDPTVTVCSPSATETPGVAWLDAYLKAGGGKYADVIGFHFYSDPGPPEQTVLPMIQQVEQVMRNDGVGDKPLWDTETGYLIQDRQSVVRPEARTGYNSVVLPESQAANNLARMYVLAWADGVSRLYWYAWDDGKMGLLDLGGQGQTLKATAIAYEQVENWLVGTKMWACGASSAGIWVCGISRPGNYLARIVWRPDHNGRFLIPADWNVREVRELTGGGSYAPGKDRIVGIGPSPILLVSPGN
jgi:hypothetical protein